jgi:formylglycine-generating enzyme required for sulfatase activity
MGRQGTIRNGLSRAGFTCTSLERPAHIVTISKGFWIGQTEVTQAVYERVARTNPSRFEGDNLPVENLSWDEAKAYCIAVGGRLPTEAEWEFAARAGAKADQGVRYPDVAAAAWFGGNSGGRPHEVAQKAPNSLGLYDTLGNVWEWVADWFVPGYAAEAQTNPHGPRRSLFHTIRGAAWYDNATYVHWTYRTGVALRFRLNVGVRCVVN